MILVGFMCILYNVCTYCIVFYICCALAENDEIKMIIHMGTVCPWLADAIKGQHVN